MIYPVLSPHPAPLPQSPISSSYPLLRTSSDRNDAIPVSLQAFHDPLSSNLEKLLTSAHQHQNICGALNISEHFLKLSPLYNGYGNCD